jgi:heme oxygenase
MQSTDPDICLRLREETADAHARLERDLDLLAEPLARGRFIAVLQGFHAFHQSWEPAMAAGLRDPAFFDPRRRLALLEADLAALGCGVVHLGACPAAAQLAATLAAAMGSLYVMEGSTLGGQLIARRLAGEAWLPEGGLRYFTPYGAATGAMWQAFRERIRAVATPANQAEIVAGARATFELLRDLLAPAVRMAA